MVCSLRLLISWFFFAFCLSFVAVKSPSALSLFPLLSFLRHRSLFPQCKCTGSADETIHTYRDKPGKSHATRPFFSLLGRQPRARQQPFEEVAGVCVFLCLRCVMYDEYESTRRAVPPSRPQMRRRDDSPPPPPLAAAGAAALVGLEEAAASPAASFR